MKTYQTLKQIISEYEKRVHSKLCTVDYAKGYCMGILSEQTSESISEDEYDELATLVDDTFDTSESYKNIPMKPVKLHAWLSTMNYSCRKWHCPSCGHELDKHKVERCFRCNQTIDWSEE